MLEVSHSGSSRATNRLALGSTTGREAKGRLSQCELNQSDEGPAGSIDVNATQPLDQIDDQFELAE